MRLEQLNHDALVALESELAATYRRLAGANQSLDLTRGKPSEAQLELSAPLDGILRGDYRAADGTDTRGYGGLDGLPEAKALAASWLDVEPHEVLVGGNSSLSLMYRYLLAAHRYGLQGESSAWCRDPEPAKFICPAPGYDRHFKICEDLGIEMISVAMTDSGPDMDQVESLVRDDRSIRGMWCVPKYANPTGAVYDHQTVERVAALAKLAAPGFQVMWDNAYAVHHLYSDRAELTPIMPLCRNLGTADNVALFGSTSKVTFAGAGLAFMAASPANLAGFKSRLEISTIGPDKVNQLRHVRFLRDLDSVGLHMQQHADILRPKFQRVEEMLEKGLGELGIGQWTQPRGGYFISFDAPPGLARSIVEMADQAGVKLTPAGAAFPYGLDPADSNIRLAPSFPPLEEVERAMQVFVCCVKLAAVRQQLATGPRNTG